MKRIAAIGGFVLTLLLGACSGTSYYGFGGATSGAPDTSFDTLAEKREAEEKSWAQLSSLSARECGMTATPPAPEKAVEVSNCVTDLVNAYVLPNAAFPPLLLSSRKEALDIAQAYAHGRISAAEYKRRSEARLKKYSRSVTYFSTQEAGAPRPRA